MYTALVLMALPCSGQVSPAKLTREADSYFEHDKFRTALKYYQEAGNPDTWNKEAALRVGISQFEINRIDESIQTLTRLAEGEKTDDYVYLYLARAYQHREEFESAIRFYKQFLRKNKRDDATRDWAKDEIKRCANGLHLKFGEETAFAENLGAVINTLDDEIGPIPSPTVQNRLYFASNRAGSKGNRQLIDGTPDAKYGDLPFDVYVTRKENGSWQYPEPMGDLFNTGQHDLFLDFSLDGQVSFLYRSDKLNAGRILTDTFSTDPDKPAGQGVLNGPLRPEYGDRDLRVFNDTILLFASARPGGYGGFDLYISVQRFGLWQQPVNLGPEINTFYDERYPCLTQNGRVLFYSSNNLHSIGGLDIFRADYDEATGAWSEPQNLGMPVNSPGDDQQFELSADGLTAFVASDRKKGFGGFDLYSVYFKKQIKENLQMAQPVTFYQHAEEFRRRQEMGTADSAALQNTGIEEEKEFYVSDLYYGEDDLIITPQNIKKLDLIANMMLIYPRLELELVCHSFSGVRPAFSLYFSVKKAEKALEYLMQKGVAPARINLKGAGEYFPLRIKGRVSPLINKLNRRISVRFQHIEEEPLMVFKEKQVLPEEVDESKLYETMTDSLYYMVQIASTTQMIQSPLLDTEPYAVIEYDYPRKAYRYLVGFARDHASIKPVMMNMRENGFDDAFIVPFIHGMRIDRKDVLKHADQYPDLLNLFE